MKIKLIILSAVVLIVILSLIYVSTVWKNNSTVTKINLTGNLTVSRNEIFELAGLKDSASVNIESLNLKQLEEKIAGHPEIKKVHISKEHQSELNIEIIEKRPVAIINFKKELKLIDEEFEIFPFKNFEKIYDLPVINGLKSFQQDSLNLDNCKNELKLALFIIQKSLSKSKYLYSMISEISFEDSSKIIIFSNDKSIPFYFPRYKNKTITDPDYQQQLINALVVFKNYQEQFPDSREKTEYVDLRYKNLVIVK